MVEESTAAAKSLADQAGELATLVGRFRIADERGAAVQSSRSSHASPSAVARPKQVALRTVGNAALKADDDWSDF
jgi:methyl-accepting chemotaxis protein